MTSNIDLTNPELSKYIRELNQQEQFEYGDLGYKNILYLAYRNNFDVIENKTITFIPFNIWISSNSNHITFQGTYNYGINIEPYGNVDGSEGIISENINTVQMSYNVRYAEWLLGISKYNDSEVHDEDILISFGICILYGQ